MAALERKVRPPAGIGRLEGQGQQSPARAEAEEEDRLADVAPAVEEEGLGVDREGQGAELQGAMEPAVGLLEGEPGGGRGAVELGGAAERATRFRLASTSKAVTAVALAALWDRGVLDLDRPVGGRTATSCSTTAVPVLPQDRHHPHHGVEGCALGVGAGDLVAVEEHPRGHPLRRTVACGRLRSASNESTGGGTVPRNRVWTIGCVVLWTLCAVGIAVGDAPPEGAVVVMVEDAEWTEIVPGVDFAPAYGVFTEEAHGKWVRFEPGVVSPFHTHTHDYHGVVIRGTVTNPYAGENDPPEMGPGTYWYVPAGALHATGCVSEEPCLFYTHGDALWDITVVEEEAAAAE